jgi:hypothetical protein
MKIRYVGQLLLVDLSPVIPTKEGSKTFYK